MQHVLKNVLHKINVVCRAGVRKLVTAASAKFKKNPWISGWIQVLSLTM